MKAVAVTVDGEKIAIVREHNWQIDRHIRKCYLNKFDRVVIERLK